MSNERDALNAALERLSVLASPASATPTVEAVTVTKAPIDLQADAVRYLNDRAVQGRQWLYLQAIPVMDAASVRTMEHAHPRVNAYLRSLSYRRSVRRELVTFAGAAVAQSTLRLRDPVAEARSHALLAQMQADVVGTPDERAAWPIAAGILIVAAFSAGFAVGMAAGNKIKAGGSDESGTKTNTETSSGDDTSTSETDRQTVATPGDLRWPIPVPSWPWPVPKLPIGTGASERSDTLGMPASHGDVLEMLEAVYPRPDVRAVCIDAARVQLDLLSGDEVAYGTLQQLVSDASGSSLVTTEREPLTTGIVVAAVAAAAIGFAVGYALSNGNPNKTKGGGKTDGGETAESGDK